MRRNGNERQYDETFADDEVVEYEIPHGIERHVQRSACAVTEKALRNNLLQRSDVEKIYRAGD